MFLSPWHLPNVVLITAPPTQPTVPCAYTSTQHISPMAAILCTYLSILSAMSSLKAKDETFMGLKWGINRYLNNDGALFFKWYYRPWAWKCLGLGAPHIWPRFSTVGRALHTSFTHSLHLLRVYRAWALFYKDTFKRYLSVGSTVKGRGRVVTKH